MTRFPSPIWGLVAAAGAGLRFGAETPKQFVSLAGRPMLAHAVDALAADDRVRSVMVVLPPGGPIRRPRGLRSGCAVLVAAGSGDRSGSVANGLARLVEAAGAEPGHWVLVHDAARPCLHREDLAALIDAGLRHPTGALLAVPVRDTLKRARAGAANGEAVVDATVPRDRMWRALTPQMFRLSDLAGALAEAAGRGAAITDDAQAMEGWAARRGRPPPRLVEARHENLKVTARGDLAAAGLVLAARTEGRQ